MKLLAQAVKYLVAAGALVLLAALFGELIAPRLRFISAIFVIAGAGFALVGWWHFAKWVWQLLVGKRRR